jgi:flagellar protein FlgJ
MTQVSGTASTLAAYAATSPTGAQAAAATGERAQLAKAAKAFEAIFMRQMLSTMRQSGLGEDIAGSSAVDQFRELSDAKMAENLSGQGNLGIANLILRQLEKTS